MIITREEIENAAIKLLKNIHDYKPFTVKNASLDKSCIENHGTIIDKLVDTYRSDITDVLRKDSVKLSNAYWLMRYIDNYGDKSKIDTKMI